MSEQWQELEDRGEAPEAVGRTAEEAERDKVRKRRIMPAERKRRARRLSLTVEEELVGELRRICKEHGKVDKDGRGQISSGVIERLLKLVVEKYRQGAIEKYEEEVTIAGWSLRWKE